MSDIPPATVTDILPATGKFNPLTADTDYIRFIITITRQLLMLKIKHDIIQQYIKIADLHFVKSE